MTVATIRAARAKALLALGPRPPWWRFFARRKHDAARRAICQVTPQEVDFAVRQYAEAVVARLQHEGSVSPVFRFAASRDSQAKKGPSN